MALLWDASVTEGGSTHSGITWVPMFIFVSKSLGQLDASAIDSGFALVCGQLTGADGLGSPSLGLGSATQA